MFKLMSAIRGYFKKTATRNDLYRMSDKELKDIGITRNDIDYLVGL